MIFLGRVCSRPHLVAMLGLRVFLPSASGFLCPSLASGGHAPLSLPHPMLGITTVGSASAPFAPRSGCLGPPHLHPLIPSAPQDHHSTPMLSIQSHICHGHQAVSTTMCPSQRLHQNRSTLGGSLVMLSCLRFIRFSVSSINQCWASAYTPGSGENTQAADIKLEASQ